ncbi:hypothetical protein BDV30DRAFT_239338 [Aspergillus minisclerotigenes]|uniref:Uncharacterized protein n=1 Tax=Aspergillus minisclerotigenes TaxID=656917 RepID=A0A5N6J204_9EURO|nr:hypothetical protein BDV30DRAFT_239338 [Aspergillus minisclerotigenes]
METFNNTVQPRDQATQIHLYHLEIVDGLRKVDAPSIGASDEMLLGTGREKRNLVHHILIDLETRRLDCTTTMGACTHEIAPSNVAPVPNNNNKIKVIGKDLIIDEAERAQERAADLVQLLVIKEPSLFTSKDVHGAVPLLMAAKSSVKILLRISLFCLHHLGREEFDEHHSLIPLKNLEPLLELCGSSIFETATKDGLSPLQLVIRFYENSFFEPEYVFSIVEALVNRSASSIFYKVPQQAERNSGKTAYDMVKELKKRETAASSSLERTEELLRRTCLSLPDKSLDEMTHYLYSTGAKSALRIYLNLSGESVPVDKRYIEDLKKESGMQPKNPTRNRYRNGTQEPNVSDPYPDISKWLWDSKVRRIPTVEVDDLGPRPHSNAAIRRCFTGWSCSEIPTDDFYVEVWKWKNLDICSDTIFTAAPSARDVYLYSSANTAVLRGWASESGLCKLTKLQRLTIEVHPKDGNDEKDCQEFAVEFIKTVSSRCKTLDPSNIKMIYPSDHPTQESNNLEIQRNRPKDDSIPSHGQPKPDAWILKLQPFKEFIRPILRSTGGLSARVALLDDGANLTGKYGKQKGQSFRPDKEKYFVGPCIHGTKMADCIRQLCPEVELLIARLDDPPKVESGQ